MGKLLRASGRSAVCAAALTLSPFSPNFNSAGASNSVGECAEKVSRLEPAPEICVEEPRVSGEGRNILEDYRILLVGGAALATLVVGLEIGLIHLYGRLGNLESDHTPEGIETNLARQQKDDIEAEAARKARLDNIEAWWDSRGEIPVSRYLIGSFGGILKGVWLEFKTARADAKTFKNDARAEREQVWRDKEI